MSEPVRIEKGHQHLLTVWDDLTRPDGKRAIWSKCMCGLEERRWYQAEGDTFRVYKVEVRIGGVWMDPLSLLRTMPIRLEECAACEGDPDPRAGRCQVCHGAGVTEHGQEVKLILPREPAPPATPA